MPGEAEAVLIVADVAMGIGKELYNLITAKKAEDRKAAIDAMKAKLDEGDAKLAALPSELAANDEAADKAVDAKFPPVAPAEPPRGDEPTKPGG